MGTFTRDWNETTPTNLTEAHQIDDYLKYRVIDVAERLKAMFYGFTLGENTYEASVKFLNLKDQTSVDVPSIGYSRLYSMDVDDKPELIHQNSDGDEVQITKDGKLNTALAALLSLNETHLRLQNDAFLTAVDEAGTGSVDLIKASVNEADDAEVPLLPDLTRLASVAAPTENTQIPNKKYVDDAVATAGFFLSGEIVFNTTMTAVNTWQDLDLSEYVGERAALVFLEVKNSSGQVLYFKPKDAGSTPPNTTHDANSHAAGVGIFDTLTDNYVYTAMATNAAGVIQIACEDAISTTTIKLIGHVGRAVA